MNSRMALDGFFLIQDYVQEKDGRVTYRGHGVLGWDEPGRRYAWYWTDSMGMVPHAAATGTFEGDTLTLRQETPGRGFSRYVYELRGADRLRFTIEGSPDGSAWTLFMEGDYRRA